MTLSDLFEQHHDPLYRYLVRLTGDSDLAADLAQEAFVRWVEREPANTEPRAWLFTVATNLVRDHRRVSSRRLVLLNESPEGIGYGDAPLDPEEVVETKERQAIARSILAALPEKERVLLLLQQEGFTHREIAEAVGTTVKSVGSMLARALRHFSEAAASKVETARASPYSVVR